MGNVAIAENNLPEARKYFSEVLEIDWQIVQETNTIQSYEDLASAYNKSALIDIENPDKEMIRAALDIWTELSKEVPDNDDFREYKETVEEILSSSDNC